MLTVASFGPAAFGVLRGSGGGGAGAVGGGGSCHAGRPLTAWPAFTLPAFLTSAHWVSLPWDFIAALNRISARAALSVFLC